MLQPRSDRDPPPGYFCVFILLCVFADIVRTGVKKQLKLRLGIGLVSDWYQKTRVTDSRCTADSVLSAVYRCRLSRLELGVSSCHHGNTAGWWSGHGCHFTTPPPADYDGNSEYLASDGIRPGERFRRQEGEVTILSIEENAKNPRAVGVLSSTARTFVQAGTTTEFTTQVLGTTLGRTYARLLSTGSRVFYDNTRPASRDKTKPTDAFLVFPTVLPKTLEPSLDSATLAPTVAGNVQPTRVLDEVQKVLEINSNHQYQNKLPLDELFDLSDTRQNNKRILAPNADERENVVSVRKEYSVKRNSDIKAAKVKPNNGLPTFTVRNEFAPSGFSYDETQERKEESLKTGSRNSKRLFKGGIPVKPEKKLDTVTYFGFADFTTTVGDTVIIFMPKTPNPQLAGSVTSISGEATLRPEDAPMPVVTSVKTFMSHSPGMATKTVTGHSLSMHTTLPTVKADPIVRESKAYEPVYVSSDDSQDLNTRFNIDPSPSSFDYSDSIEPSVLVEKSEGMKSPQVLATEPLSVFATTTTQVYNSADEALGLVKSIGGTEAVNGTTTVFTSFVFGTVIDGAYKQLVQSASTVFINVGGGVTTTTAVGIGIAPSTTSMLSMSSEAEQTTFGPEIQHTTEDIEITTEGSTDTTPNAQIVFPEEVTPESELSNEVDTARKVDSSGQDHTIVPDEYIYPQSSAGYITRVVPSTVYKTFTYLTTFFIPDENGGQTTSIRSREVTSEDVSYITKAVPTNEVEMLSTTVAPSEVVTDSPSTTTPQEYQTTNEDASTLNPTEEIKVESTTPQLPVTLQETTTRELTESEREEEEKTTPTPTTPKSQSESEEEVDLIFKTLYTTYTYLTTFFEESSSSVSSSEVVVTNIITTTLDNSLATDPAVAGLFGNGVLEPAPTSVGIGRPTTKYFEDSLGLRDDDLSTSTSDSLDFDEGLRTPTPVLDNVQDTTDDGFKTFYTTYTYFTTVFVDGETEIESRTEVYTNIISPSSLADITPTAKVQLFSSDYVSVLPDEQVEPPLESAYSVKLTTLKSNPVRSYDSTISRPRIKDNEIVPAHEGNTVDRIIEATLVEDVYRYDTTMSRIHSTNIANPVDEEDIMSAKQSELSKEEKLLLGVSPSEDSEVRETVVVDVTSSSSGGSRKVYRESYDDPDDQITSESNTEEIEPSFSPTILLQTSYTTFTYFTTVYKGATSDVISRLDTVTNVVTETLRPSDIEASLSPEEATLPITYFTTFTYWTTLYKDGSTMVTSREETISNIVTPTITDIGVTESTNNFDIIPTSATSIILPTVLTSVVGGSPLKEQKRLDSSVTETVTDAEIITPSPTTTESIKKDVEQNKENGSSSLGRENNLSVTEDLEPTTYYTTYTYFTTSYIGNSTVLNSHLETETNIVTPTKVNKDLATEQTTKSSVLNKNSMLNTSLMADVTGLKPTGLISTIRTSEVNDGITTLFSTDVYGTYIEGLYAQILESSTQILSSIEPTSTVVNSPQSVQPTGIVSINEGKIVDADGVSTTFFTTKAVGTYIDQLYAQVIESSTSVQVDEERKTAAQTQDPSTTVVGSKSFRTGLVRLIEGSIVKDKTTTFYESRVIGTLIDGRYAQIIESTSSFKVEMTPTAAAGISPTSVLPGGVTIAPTASLSTSPSPAVIESSIGDSESDNDDEDHEGEDDDESSKGRSKSRLSFSTRKKTFTPVIRPFASRPRPTFLPKKKTGDVGSATTITRNAFTPTITATPAVKSSDRGFGSSRNRFAGGRRSSSSSIQATASASTGRRFSGRRGSSTTAISPASASQSSFRGRSSGRISPTSSSAFGSSSRRGGFNYRTSSGLRSSSSITGSSRFRVRPTLSSSVGKPLQTVSSTTEDITNTNDIGGATVVTEDSLVTLEDEEQETSPPSTTTTESPRRSNNPLLRFRRPPILQRSSTTTTTPKPTTSPARRSSLLRRPDSRGTATTPVTPSRNRPSPTFPSRNRQRPSNSLFPPRGLLRKPSPSEEAEEEPKEEENDDDVQNDTKLEEENDFSDNDYEGSEHSESQHSTPNETTTTEISKTDRRGKAANVVQIRPFRLNRQPRKKRQATEYGTRNYRSRYQRTKSRSSSPDDYLDDSEPLPSELPTTRTPSRFTPRSRAQTTQQSQPRVRPTKPSPSAGRAQFTLRDKTSSQTSRSNFKRPTSRRRPSTPESSSPPQRPKPPRLRTQTTTHTQQQETTYTSRNGGRRFTSSRRPTSRSRYRDSTDFDTYSFSPSSFDGTITVTHQVPTEVTIPVVNGKVTEYKNVITAKPSLEILSPHQYTSTTGKDGNFVIQLTSEVTSTLPNGVMEITKFIVYETPTTSITFTPTTLRGRKTSFSHIVPSTVYDVKQEVSTVQPQIAANAPLANLLLSQLLLGNLNLQPNPQQLNPLLGLQNQQIVPPTPTTEYKTKTTTYVTTVTDHTSTVIPLTFRGKEILTTIVDSSTQVITATEYLTETIVITPTAAIANNPQQINTLLLPALLQAQLLGQTAQQPTINPLLGTLQQQILPQDILNIQEEKLQVEEPAQRFVSRRRPIEETEEKNSQEYELEETIEQPKPETKTRKKVKVKTGAKKPPDAVAPSIAETSVVTLYVSGRRPGDFSTILSTVTLGEESSVTVRKREAEYIFEDLDKSSLEFSKLPEIGGSFSGADDSYMNHYVMSALNEIPVEGSDLETQSLESIVGDVSTYITGDNSKINTELFGQPSKINEDINTEQFKIASSKISNKSTGHFLSKSPAEDAPSQRIGQEKITWSNKTTKYTDDSIFIMNGKSMRVKRQIEDTKIDQPRRKKVKVRVPVQRRVNVDEDLTPLEAQRSQDITQQELLQTQDPLIKTTDFGTRKIKVIRKRPKIEETGTTEQNTAPRRRVAVRRRRPVLSTVDEDLYVSHTQYEYDQNQNIQPSETSMEYSILYPTDVLQQTEPTPRRKKVLVARRRPKPPSSIIDSTTRRKILVTKKRPVIKTKEQIEPATIYSNFFVGLQTDYDYESPTVNTELEETNNDNSYTTHEINISNQDEINDYNQEGNIDDIRIPTWVPENSSHIIYQSFTSSEIENSHIPESIVWFYEPTEEIIIDVTPTKKMNGESQMSEDFQSFSNILVLSPSVSTTNELLHTELSNHNLEGSSHLQLPLSSSTISDIPLVQETIIEQIPEQSIPPTESQFVMRPSTVELESSFTPLEETTTYEGAPKFVRPTRFSVTRKPSRVITGFPGTRRRQLVTSFSSSSIISSHPNYTSKKSNLNKYETSKNIVQTSSTDVLPTEMFDLPTETVHLEEDTKPTITSDISPESSLSNYKMEQPSSITPMLAEYSTDSLKKSGHEHFATPIIPTSYLTTVVTSTRLRTYTYVVSRVSGDESIVTSSTSVKPALKTLTLTIPIVAATNSVSMMDEGRGFQLATKVMSNGVEVIVAGDRTTMPGAPEVLRKLPATVTRPITLAPSTLSDAMMMMLPQGQTQESSVLMTNTYLTTYTYLTTLLQGEETVVSSREDVVSNVVTEERRPTVMVEPTPVTKVTLTASPSLGTGVYHTTYTYLNTLVDGEVPLVLTSRLTVSNTVTAPEDLLQPSEPTGLETNTYLNTVSFTKTLADGSDFKIVSTKDVMTQVIITESDNKPSSVEIKPTPTAMTTDVVKTYFVTYTYFNTMLDGEETVVQSEVATSSDVVTEKFVLPPKRTSLNSDTASEYETNKINPTKAPETESTDNSILLFATKTYLTTFTYFTTLLQDNNGNTPSTVVSSRTSVVQNLVTETLDTELFDSNYLSSLRSTLETDISSIVTIATLNDGQKMEITAVGEQMVKPTISPANHISSSFEDTSSNNNVITGSTIIFFDENDQIDEFTPTSSKTLAIDAAGHTILHSATTENQESSTETTTDNYHAESLSAAESQALTLTTGDSETEKSHKTYETSILVSSTITKNGATLLPGAQVIKFKDPNGNISIIPVSDPVSKHPDGTSSAVTGSNAATNNFLRLGSLGINSLNALGPVINAMAGLIKNNLKSDQRRRNDSLGMNSNEPIDVHLNKNPLMMYAGPKPPAVRSPIYIPVGGLAADSVAEESQNVEGHNVFPDSNQRNKLSVVLGRPTMESPLLAGGIPISPGQVITTNSDVIIGKHSVHGVRPPDLSSKPHRKDDVPFGMKPPPLPKNKPNWPVRDHNGHYIPLSHHPLRETASRPQFHREPSYPPSREHLNNYDTINYNTEIFKHQENFKKHPNNNRPISHNDYYIPPPRKEQNHVVHDLRLAQLNKPQYYPTQQNIQVYSNVPNNNFDTRPAAHSDTEAINTINTNVEYVNPIQHAPILLPDSTDFVDQTSVNPLLVNIKPSQVANVIIPHGSSTALIYNGEHSQKGEIFNDPSPYPDAQVDHVVDALSTSRPSPEGEGITHAARVPINANNLDVPVAPHGINVAGNQLTYKINQNKPQTYQPQQHKPQPENHEQLYQAQFGKHNQRPLLQSTNHHFINQQNYENLPVEHDASILGEYLKPPPPPSDHFYSPSNTPNRDESFTDDVADQEEGEVIQESNVRPLRPGQLPIELTAHPSTSMPIDPIDDENHKNTGVDGNNVKSRPVRLDQDINFSVVNSKPVQLDGISSINKQAAIINGRPGINKFTEKSQATLVVGLPTQLRPDNTASYDGQHFNHNDRPKVNNFNINPTLLAAISPEIVHDDRPTMVKTIHVDEKDIANKHPKPVQTMSLDEKPPPPTEYETPPQQQSSPSIDLVNQGNTPRPFIATGSVQNQFDRNSQRDDSVVGLSPPPPENKFTTHEETSTRPVIPLGTSYRRPLLPPPRKPRPPPPYKFEIPPPPMSDQEDPALQDNFDSQILPMLPDTLSPPKPSEVYLENTMPKIPTTNKKPIIQQQWTAQSDNEPITVSKPDIINPTLQGVLKVEEHSQQPEVITADSKVMTNIIKGQRPKPETGIKITGSQPSLQTVIVGKPVSVPVTDAIPNIVINPTAVNKPNLSQNWKDSFIVGSETIIDDTPHFATPIKQQDSSSNIRNKPSSILVTKGVTTIFNDLFTKPSTPIKIIKPTKSMQNHHSVISVVVEAKENNTKSDNKIVKDKQKDHHKVVLKVVGDEGDEEAHDGIITAPPPTTFVVTHTQTTTVTTTETTVVHSKGKEPSTHTLVLTKTQTSTLLDTVTEVHTLVKQTSILATVTTTIPQATSTVYTGFAEPEEYLVYPHSEAESTKPPKKENKPAMDPHDNESIFVVMTDKKPGTVKIHTVPEPESENKLPPEIQVPDEANEINPDEIRRGQVFTHPTSDNECWPECKASRNELCQKIDNVMRCVCRPGFARMFPDRPCKPTYTYTMRLSLDRYGKDKIRFSGPLEDPTSVPYQRLIDATREGLDRTVMQSDLRDIYHGIEVKGFEPASTPDSAVVKYYIQLSDNTDESRLQDVLRKSLRSNNYSLGGTEVYAAKEQIQYLLAEDFDECTDPKYHDCSEEAQCFNLHGSYTCSCKEGFSDLSPNTLYPGRVCSAEQIGCELCNFHGTCYSRNNEEIMCECFQWYGGATCQINLKVLLMILVTVAVCLVVLLIVCFVLACMRRGDRPRGPALRPGGGFRRYRSHGGGTGDKRAMISVDTSSEGSVDNTPPAYIKQAAVTAQRQKVLRKAASKGPAPLHVPVGVTVNTEQRDRSLTVMIPRAKYRPAPAQPTNTLLTMSTFGPEQKLLNYLNPEGRSTPEKQGSRNNSRKPSNSTSHQSEQVRSRKPSSQPLATRKPSTGALVSAGFEVSATVGRTKELDESFLEEPHTDLSQPGFNTIRTGESCIIVDIPPPPTLEAELEDIIIKVDRLTVSEARSYDETTIHPPTKSLHRDYDSKRLSSSSHRANDEGHTMVERDIGSTFMMPQTHLFKPDRGSDISNFDSL